MNRRALSTFGITVIATMLLSVASPLAKREAFAQSGCQTSKETSKTVCGRFLQYWSSHGGVAQQGFPISNEMPETSATDGKTYTVQYFERAVFELHPENRTPSCSSP